MMYVLLIISSSRNKRFQTAHVDSFSKDAAINFHCTIGVDSSDDVWTFGRFVHLGLAATFIGVEDNEHLVTRKILFGDSGFFFFCIRCC